MKSIGGSLLTSIQRGTASLCRIWKVVPLSGPTLFFTDADEDVTFDGDTYLSSTGFMVSDVSTSASSGAGSADLKFFFGDDINTSITKEKLKRGYFDNCTVLIQIIDRENPSYGAMTLLDGTAKAPEGTNRGYGNFQVVSKLERALQKIGGVYQSECATTLYSAQCGVNKASFSTTGVVGTVTNRRKFTVDFVSNPENYYYSFGLLLWTSGLNTGFTCEVLTQYSLDATFDQILLALNTPYTVAAADAFTIYAGCDLRPSTCKDKFNNLVNYRGFPYFPGPDRITKNPRAVE